MRLLIGAVLVSALLLGGVPSARAMAPKPEPEDIANAAALMAAPWLACSLGPDSAAGLPDGVKWNWERAQFEVNDGSPYVDKFVIVFDDEKRRAKILGEKEGQFLPFPTPFVIHPAANSSPPMAISIGVDPPVGDIFVISRRRTANGGFLAIVKSTVRIRFVSDPEVGLVPMSCAPTADDALTQQIEQARAEWLTTPVEPEVPQQ